MPEHRKREIAHKLRIIDLLKAKQIFEETETLNKRLNHVELGNRNIVRINLIANIIDKYQSEGEKRFATITLDDGSGQIRARVFADDVALFTDMSQGDTVLIIGLLRFFNQELYILPELIKKYNPKYLLIRKLEIEKSFPPIITDSKKKEIKALRDELIGMIKEAETKEGIDKEEIIIKLKSQPQLITQEIQKLLEDGVIYEPRPGRVRYLG